MPNAYLLYDPLVGCAELWGSVCRRVYLGGQWRRGGGGCVQAWAEGEGPMACAPSPHRRDWAPPSGFLVPQPPRLFTIPKHPPRHWSPPQLHTPPPSTGQQATTDAGLGTSRK